MTFLQWVIVVWVGFAILVAAVATWFGWHLHRGKHARYADRSEPSSRPVRVRCADTPPRIPRPRD